MYMKTTNLKFSAYGHEEIYNKLDGYKELIHELFDDGEMERFYVSTKPVYLELIDGIGMVVVSKDFDHYECFSFYRPLVIDAGIGFNLICMSGHVKFKLAYRDVESIASVNIIKYSKIKHNTSIDEILGYYYHIRNTEYELHNVIHDFCELYFVDYGTLSIDVDDQSFVLETGNFMFFCPYQKFSISTKKLKKTCSYMKIIFRAKICDEKLLINKMFTTENEIRQLLNEYIKVSYRKHWSDDDLMLAYIQLIITKVIRKQLQLDQSQITTDNPMQVKYDEELLNSILIYIEKNLTHSITLTSLCDEFNISKGVIYKTFQKNLNISPIKYINNQRCILSAKLIKSNEYTVTMVSQMLGYSSIHYFSRQFKEYYGITPSEYANTVY